MLTQVLIADSRIIRLAESVDPDLLGAIGLVSAIMFFVVLIVSVATIGRTVENITLAKMQNKMINELLANGCSVDEIQQLITGNKRSVLTRMFDRNRQAYVNRRPAPPVKTGV